MQSTATQPTEARQIRGAKRRKSARTPVFWPARLLVDGHAVDGMVLDVSAEGARLHLEHPPECTTIVTLQNARFGEFRGEVMWSGEGVLGLSFLDQPQSIARMIEGIPPQYRAAW